jgi:excisionase family DNA binding protein
MIADRVAARLTAVQEREKKRLYSTEEAAHYLSLGNAQVYRLTVSGKLRSIREGRRRLIDCNELDRWIPVRIQETSITFYFVQANGLLGR